MGRERFLSPSGVADEKSLRSPYLEYNLSPPK